MASDKLITYSMEQTQADIDSIYRMVKRSDFVPNYIVGIMRGGIVPAVTLSHLFKKPCIALKWSLRDHTGREYGILMDTIVQKATSEGKKFLIVDDIIDSGDTLTSIKAQINQVADPNYWSKYIKFAALWFNTSQQETVDYYINEIDRLVDQRWVVFNGWER
jgi:hypoxanthine phosphoribosyltransferase